MREWSLNGCLAVSSLSAFEELSCGSSSPIGGLCRRNWKSFHCSDRENDSKLHHGIYSQMCWVQCMWAEYSLQFVRSFLFVRKSQLLAAFTSLQSGSFSRSVSKGRSLFCFHLWLERGKIFWLYHVCSSGRAACTCLPLMVYQWCGSADSGVRGQCSSEVSTGRQLINKAGVPAK